MGTVFFVAPVLSVVDGVLGWTLAVIAASWMRRRGYTIREDSARAWRFWSCLGSLVASLAIGVGLSFLLWAFHRVYRPYSD